MRGEDAATPPVGNLTGEAGVPPLVANMSGGRNVNALVTRVTYRYRYRNLPPQDELPYAGSAPAAMNDAAAEAVRRFEYLFPLEEDETDVVVEAAVPCHAEARFCFHFKTSP